MRDNHRGRRRRRRDDGLRLGPHGTADQRGLLVSARTLDGSLAELTSLFGAETPRALQQAMVIPTRRAATNCWDAVTVVRAVHGEDDTGLVELLALACTSRRWEKVARALLMDLDDHGLLHSGVTGTLAITFLQTDVVAVTAPGAWLADFYLQLRDGDLHPLDPAETYTLRRPVTPQLRRWAACESVRERADIAPVLTRALALDSRHGAAVVLGLLDACDQVDPRTATELIGIGMEWPSASVRLPALKRLAAMGRDGDALVRAAHDPAAHVRSWAAAGRQRALPGRRRPCPHHGRRGGRGRRRRRAPRTPTHALRLTRSVRCRVTTLPGPCVQALRTERTSLTWTGNVTGCARGCRPRSALRPVRSGPSWPSSVPRCTTGNGD